METRLTNHEGQGLRLAKTLTPSKHFFDLDALFDVLPARSLPGYERARLAGEIPLGKDVVGEVRQTLTLEVRHVEADALGRGVGVTAVHVLIVHPNGKGGVGYMAYPSDLAHKSRKTQHAAYR
jgi:hypothetical protein